ncbi:MAG: thiamine pyrophosphate-dependent enzyme [Clostridia bacterium]|nr:thiamine pyrophosphate-dependent enzyme [Clostridia bacterium]
MAVFKKKPEMLTDVPFHYCPGCTHGIAHRLVAEVIDELNIKDHLVGIAPVGCAVFAYDYFNCDMQEAAHGRAPAVATGIKRSDPNNIVFAYQGDGDLASIGMAEIVHAAARSENITVIFINNAIYGMTGGQMAPTTMLGQKASTCQKGRTVAANGYPIHVSEMLSQLQGPAYIERCALTDVPHINKAKAAIKHAFRNQIDGKGFSLVELISTCPSNWKMSPLESIEYAKNEMMKIYPLGVYKDIDKEAE